jgi:hypothetical protein
VVAFFGLNDLVIGGEVYCTLIDTGVFAASVVKSFG